MTKHFDYKLNFHVLFNTVLSNTSLLYIMQHSFIQSVKLLVQPMLLHTKYQGLGQLSVRPGRAAQSCVALTGEPPVQSFQVCERRSPKDKVALLNVQDPETLGVQMEVVIGLVVFPDTAAVSSTQEVAAELGGHGDIGDVRVEGGGEVG